MGLRSGEAQCAHAPLALRGGVPISMALDFTFSGITLVA